MKVRVGARRNQLAKSSVRERVAIPMRPPREGWEDAFSAMVKRGDDRLLDESPPTVFDETEWE